MTPTREQVLERALRMRCASEITNQFVTTSAGKKLTFGQLVKYRVAFKSEITGFQSHGAPLDSYEVARAWVDHMNAEYPEIKHWVEEVR